MSPRTKEQFQKMREAGRAKILDAAIFEFSRKGYNGTKIDDIATTAKVAKGSIYHYYKSKEELLEAVLDLGLQKSDEIMQQSFAASDGETFMEKFIDSTLSKPLDDLKFWRLFTSVLIQADIPEKVTKKFKSYMRNSFDQLADLFALPGEDKEKTKERTSMIAASIDGIWLHAIVFGVENYNEETTKKIFKKIFLKRNDSKGTAYVK